MTIESAPSAETLRAESLLVADEARNAQEEAESLLAEAARKDWEEEMEGILRATAEWSTRFTPDRCARLSSVETAQLARLWVDALRWWRELSFSKSGERTLTSFISRATPTLVTECERNLIDSSAITVFMESDDRDLHRVQAIAAAVRLREKAAVAGPADRTAAADDGYQLAKFFPASIRKLLRHASARHRKTMHVASKGRGKGKRYRVADTREHWPELWRQEEDRRECERQREQARRNVQMRSA
jgi:hypothetical protein